MQQLENRSVLEIGDVAGIPQHVVIRNHLIQYGTITPWEAWENYHITRLSAIIYVLKYKKYPLMDIEAVRMYELNRHGVRKNYAKYFFNGFLEDNG